MACEPVLGLQVAVARKEASILVPARLPIGSTQDWFRVNCLGWLALLSGVLAVQGVLVVWLALRARLVH